MARYEILLSTGVKVEMWLEPGFLTIYYMGDRGYPVDSGAVSAGWTVADKARALVRYLYPTNTPSIVSVDSL